MIQVSNLTKHYGPQIILENISFVISRGEKIGLVGRNGSGKTTLFRLLQGIEIQDEGVISIPKNYRIGALQQHINFSKRTVWEECGQGLTGEEEFDFYKVEKILFGLGFTKEDMDRSPEEFSGGYQIRINLAKVLVSAPDLLLLDEPTNYLDIVSLRWLRNFLRSFPGEFILITHDRSFMDEVTTHTMGIYRKRLKKISGKSVKFFEQIEIEDKVYESTRLNQEKRRKEMEDFVTRFKAKASKASQAQSRIKMLEKMDTMEKLVSERELGFRFNFDECKGKFVTEVENLGFSYDGNSGNFLFDNLNFSVGRDDRIAVIGKNGKGKSTLLNVLGGDLAPVNGQISSHPNLKIGHFGQMNIQRLKGDMTIFEEIYSANTDLSVSGVRGICGAMMFEGEFGDKLIRVLSGGERARVTLGKILANPTNLLLLDEPTNHLDMESVESLVRAIDSYPGAVLIVTHSEDLLRRVATKLIVFHHDKAEFFNGSYDDFLGKIGWEDEDGQPAETFKAPEKISRKEIRRMRSEIIKERGKIVGPLKEEIGQLEERISNLEESLRETNDLLVEASSEMDGNGIQKYSIEVKRIEKEIDDLFNRLEDRSDQLEGQTAVFDERLAKIDSFFSQS